MSGRMQPSIRRCVRNLWAITCYFNPIAYKRRLENYHTFRQHLAVPLVTTELSFDGNFQLQHDDADILVQLHGGDVLWQKERLLNVALKSVPVRIWRLLYAKPHERKSSNSGMIRAGQCAKPSAIETCG